MTMPSHPASEDGSASAFDASEALQAVKSAQHRAEAMAANRAAVDVLLLAGIVGMLFLPFGSSLRPFIDAALAAVGTPASAVVVLLLIAVLAFVMLPEGWRLGFWQPRIPLKQSGWRFGVYFCAGFLANRLTHETAFTNVAVFAMSLWLMVYLVSIVDAVWAGRQQGIMALVSLAIFTKIWTSTLGADRFDLMCLFAAGLIVLGLWFRFPPSPRNA